MRFVKVNKVLVGTVLATTLFAGGVLPSTVNPFEVSTVEASTKVSQDNKIMGTSKATAYQMSQFVKNKKGNATKLKGVTVDQLAQMFLEEGAKEGVRGDVAFAQSILETGYFTFEGSSVTPDQHNYAGIGTTGGGVKGNYFATARTGVRAQIQHLKAYASKEPLKLAKVDPRYDYVTKGIAPTFQDLQGRWAMKKGSNYGDVILGIYAEILAVPNTVVAKQTTSTVKQTATSNAVSIASTKYKVTSNVNVRATAGTSGKLITTAKKDTIVTVSKSQKVGSTTWYYGTFGTTKGWITSAYLTKVTTTTTAAKPVAASSTSKKLKTTANLNLRASASNTGQYLTTLKKGTVVTSTKTAKVGTTTWHYVTAGVHKGWVTGAYLA